MKLSSTGIIKIIPLALTVTCLTLTIIAFFRHNTIFPGNYLLSFHSPYKFSPEAKWPLGLPYKPIDSDDIRIFYPQRNLTAELLGRFKIPLWNPYSFCGNYHLGLSETAVFYPLFLLITTRNQNLIWSFLMLVEPVIAGLGLYLFLSQITGSRSASLIGGISFGISGLMLVRMSEGLSIGHSLIWIGFIFFSQEMLIKTRKRIYVLLSVLFMILPILAGWMQYTIYAIVFSLIYTVYRTIVCHTDLKLPLIPYLAAPLLTLYHIIPVAITYLDSPREIAISPEYKIIQLASAYHFITLFIPDIFGNPAVFNYFGPGNYKDAVFYIGVLPAILVLFSLRSVRNNFAVVFFLISGGIFYLLGTDTILGRVSAYVNLPIFSSFLPNRILSLCAFSLSVLAAFGYRLFYLNKIKKNEVVRVCLIFVLLFILLDIYLAVSLVLSKYHRQVPLTRIIENKILSQGYVRSPENIILQIRNALFYELILLAAFGLLLVKTLTKTRHWFFAMTLFSLFFSQIYFAKKYISVSEIQTVFPQQKILQEMSKIGPLDRWLSLSQAHVISNILQYYRLYSPEGVSAMYPRRYAELIAYTTGRGKSDNIQRVETEINPDLTMLIKPEMSMTRKLMDITGSRFILTRTADLINLSPANLKYLNFQKISETDDWAILENKSALPRYFWTDEYEIIRDRKETLRRLFDPARNPQKLLLNKPLNPKVNHTGLSDSAPSVTLIAYQPDTVIFSVRSNRPGLLYLNDNNSPLWTAYINSDKTEILTANYTFRTVFVPAGNNSVTFRINYLPVYAGFLISGICFLGLIFCLKYLRFDINRFPVNTTVKK